MDGLPQPQSLTAQAVAVLMDRIRSGRLAGRMPSEERLCEMLQVSRKTVRRALVHLEEQQWIGPGHRGRRREILRGKSGRGGGPRSKSRTVAFLTPYRESHLPPAQLLNVEILTALLAADGYRVRIVNSKAFGLKRPGSSLRELVAGEGAAAWVLHHSTEPMQRWFARHNQPAVILGTAYPDVRLPGIDSDMAACARHAVGLLMGRGHERIGLLLPEPPLAGDRRTAEGAHEAIDSHSGRKTDLQVVGVSNEAAEITTRLVKLFARSSPPTAIISARAPHTLTLVTWLGTRGIRVPDDVSVVCLFSDATFDAIWPAVTRYDVNRRSMMSKLHRMLAALFRNDPIPAEMHWVVPECIRGGSVGAPSAKK